MVSAVFRHTVSREIAVRRADRLFQIIQVLRRSTQPVTASQLAVELEVSQRSVYRDVADLIGQRVPIRGEAGIGYVLDRDFDMPPLMLTPDELEAAVLGAQWVADRGDAVLPRGRLAPPILCQLSWRTRLWVRINRSGPITARLLYTRLRRTRP
jgi:hypothetical protein